jgi:hypothetical protein
MGKTAFSGPVYGAKSLLWVTARRRCRRPPVGVHRQRVSATGLRPARRPALRRLDHHRSVFGLFDLFDRRERAQWKLKVEGGSTVMQRSNGQDSTNAATILTIASGGSSNVESWPRRRSRPGSTKARGVPRDPRSGG